MRENSFVSVPPLSSETEKPNTSFPEMIVKMARWILRISLFALLLDVALRSVSTASPCMCIILLTLISPQRFKHGTNFYNTNICILVIFLKTLHPLYTVPSRWYYCTDLSPWWWCEASLLTAISRCNKMGALTLHQVGGKRVWCFDKVLNETSYHRCFLWVTLTCTL